MSTDPLSVMAQNALGSPSMLNFPADLPLHFMSFNFIKYSWDAAQGSASFVTNPTVTIALPIPAQLVDSFNVRYNEENISPIAKAVMNVATNQGNAKMQSDSKSVTKSLKDAVLNAAPAQAYKAADAVASGLGGNLGAVTGTIPNPNATLIFGGVDLKQHNFSWTLVPKNYNESQTLTNIIKILKSKMLPAVDANYFLDYPDLCEIQIGGSDPSSLYNFKRCFLKSAVFNYAPFGPAFYAGAGAPVAVQIDLVFQETNIWTRTDITGEQGNIAGGFIDSTVQAFKTGLGISSETNQDAGQQNPIPPSGPANGADTPTLANQLPTAV